MRLVYCFLVSSILFLNGTLAQTNDSIAMYKSELKNASMRQDFFYWMTLLHEAIPFFEAQTPIDTAFVKELYWDLATIHARKKDYKTAIEYLEHIDYDMFSIGKYYEELGNYTQARAYYKKGLEELKTIKNKAESQEQQLTLYIALAENYTADNQLDSANIYTQLASKMPDKEKYYPLSLAILQKNYAQAERILLNYTKDKGQRLATLSRIYNELANVSLLNKDYQKAYIYAQNALYKSAGDSSFQLVGLPRQVVFGNLQLEINEVKIVQQKLQAAMVLAQQKDSIITPLVAYETAKYCIKLLEESLTFNTFIWNNNPKKTAETIATTYEQAIESAYLQYQHTQDTNALNFAFSCIEKIKFFKLEKTLQLNNRLGLGNVPDSLIAKLHAAQSNLYISPKFTKNGNGEYSKYSTQVQELNVTIRANYPKYANVHYPRIPTVAQLQESMNDSSVMIHYFEGKEVLYALTIYKKGVQFKQYTYPNYKQLVNDLNHILVSPSKSEYNAFFNIATRFYQQYVQTNLPDSSYLKTTKQLIIMPDGLLNTIPFEVLLYDTISVNAQEEFRSMPYLIRQYSISYQYNGTIWYQQQQPFYPINYQILSFSVLDNNVLKYLTEHTRGAIYKSNEFNAKIWSDNAPYYGFLYLDLGNQDSMLKAEEIQGWDLKTTLIILPNVTQAGIKENFWFAGTNGIVAALWQSQTPENRFIVEAFLDYTQKGWSRDKALQQAKLDYIYQAKGQDAHPNRWANMIQLGDYQAISISKRITIWWYILPIAALVIVGRWALKGLRQRRKF